MDVSGRKVLVLGGYGLVGIAVCRELLARSPAELQLHSLRESECISARDELLAEWPDANITLSWGDLFGLADGVDPDRELELQLELLRDEDLAAFRLYQLLLDRRPDIVIDCVNTATGIAYRDIFRSASKLREEVEADNVDTASARQLLEALYVPRLIRHIQVLYRGMIEAKTRIYLKVGTSGTGGMGLNIPYTHSEERPSRVLLSKSSIAGAHTMLLFLLARTPDAPMIKEIKPAAAIGWKRIDAGPVTRAGRRIPLYDCPPERAVEVERALAEAPDGWRALEDPEGEPRVLESVFIDTGENGVFSCEEFETVTALGQMEYVTPEEIADHVMLELTGGSGGREMVAALDGAVMGPTYRAGEMRHTALERMRRLERETGYDSVAFEMLGPPRLSKLLYEGHLLRRVVGTLAELAEADPEACSRGCAALLAEDETLRAKILSIGIPIRWPDGTISRGPEMKIPPYKEEARVAIDPERIERWAEAGWVDLRPGNFERWRRRAGGILASLEDHPEGDTSSERHDDREYWRPDRDLPVGRVAAWIFGVEDEGDRGKPS